MKKILLACFAILLLVSLVGCGSSSSSSNTSSNTGSQEVTKDSSKKNVRISFAFDDKSSKTYKEHVQDLWNQTKVLWNEDAKKTYSDEEYIKFGKEMDEAWVNLQSHISIPTNKHDQAVEDTSDSVLGNMTGNMLGDIDKLYGERSESDTKVEREARRKTAISNLAATIKEYDDKLANLSVK